jgi:large subunit ribosomal protein L25
LPKAIQRNPIKDTFEHVDLLVVRRGEKVTVEVRVVLVGDAARETLVMLEHDTLAVLADATRVPERLEASIEGLEAGSQVKAADVKLPSGVELAADPDMVVAVVAGAPTAEALEGETAAEAGEAEGAAEPTPEPAEA